MEPTDEARKIYLQGYEQGMADAFDLLARHLKDVREDILKKFKEAGHGAD